MNWTVFVEHLHTNSLVSTLILVAAVGLGRWFLVRLARGDDDILHEEQRRWISRIKNGAVTLLVIGLIFVWLPELNTFALSITAFAVAFVIATKELILCVSGALLRTGTHAYRIGDWIDVNGISGEVVDHSLLSTSVAEIDAKHNRYDFTGKTVILPNSVLLTQHVKNQNFLKTYVFHEFSIYTEPEINVGEARDFILDRIETYSMPFRDIARRYNAMIEKRTGVDLPQPDPRVYITTNELAKSVFTVIIFCPMKEAVALEQEITRDFLSFFYERRKTAGSAGS
jgi:small-conductance mechanosensitive channel